MKKFTEPKGKFTLQIPINWRYTNVGAEHEEKSPFSFQPYENPNWAFQVSCYSKEEKDFDINDRAQNFNTSNLIFEEGRIDDDEHNIHLWGALVVDHLIMAKFIYDRDSENDERIKTVLEQIKNSLASFVLLSPEKRDQAFKEDKFEKFTASIAASYDLKRQALSNRSFIEFTIIVANQIDAYLRMAIILKNQLDNKNDFFDIKYVYQSDTDKAIFEKNIYGLAKELNIIDGKLFDELYLLYSDRNKMVHRYIISEIRTRDLLLIAYKYESICEKINSVLFELENKQIETGFGVYGKGAFSEHDYTEEALNFLHAQVNDKHLIEEFERKINAPNNK